MNRAGAQHTHGECAAFSVGQIDISGSAHAQGIEQSPVPRRRHTDHTENLLLSSESILCSRHRHQKHIGPSYPTRHGWIQT